MQADGDIESKLHACPRASRTGVKHLRADCVQYVAAGVESLRIASADHDRFACKRLFARTPNLAIEVRNAPAREASTVRFHIGGVACGGIEDYCARLQLRFQNGHD